MLGSIIDIASIRQELPSVTAHTYMNAASFGPLLRCVPQAMDVWLQKECFEGRLGMSTFETMGELYAEARSYIARFLNARTDEIALTGNTGEGLNIICQGLKWLPGDEVIITDHEHISLIILLHYIRDRYGITIRIAELGPGLELPAEEVIARLITPRTRLIVLSHVSFMTGMVLDVRAVAELAHQSNILILVDGAQSAGVIPIDVKELGVDCYAFPMQKWLCGPDGTGALYVRREILEQVQLSYVGGWFSLKYKGLGEWGFQDSAQRFELGGRHTAAVAGQVASLRWLEEIPTYPWVFRRISFLNRYAYEGLKDIAGIRVLTLLLECVGTGKSADRKKERRLSSDQKGLVEMLAQMTRKPYPSDLTNAKSGHSGSIHPRALTRSDPRDHLASRDRECDLVPLANGLLVETDAP